MPDSHFQPAPADPSQDTAQPTREADSTSVKTYLRTGRGGGGKRVRKSRRNTKVRGGEGAPWRSHETHGGLSTGIACPEKLWSLFPCRYSKTIWTQS